MQETFWLWELLGRLHPLVVHFPIGLLVVAFLLEVFTMRGRREGLRDGIYAMVAIGAATAVLASVFGWLLSLSGGYAGDTLDNHKWSGLATAVFAVIAFLTLKRALKSQRKKDWQAYRLSFVLCLIGITIAGHLGASLTHGSDYLTAALPWNQRDSQASALLSEFRSVSDNGALETAQLDRLNLEVRALFAHTCYRCHSTEKHEGDLILDNKEGVFAGGESGPILIAGDADGSEIIRRLKLPRDHEDVMPQKGESLTDDEIALISLWIDTGAHWADQALKVFPEAEMALSKPALPAGRELTHPIDQFVDVYFQENRIRWPEPVSDEVFIRRAYLDIIGLLPPAPEVMGFEMDKSTDKRKVLVLNLLNRTHDYTQHWLSFWNDLLRNDYSGTGFITGGRKQITPWLYDALLENWSYDRIARELLNPTEASQGFIQGIQWRGTVNNSQSIQMQAAQNISQSLLGTNLKCASCHNSFVSNLTLDQAYGFASIFSDSTMQVYRCDKPTGRMANPAFLYPELGQIDGATVEERLVQLADVIVQPANGRLYRTITNRIWDRLTGRGIIMPVDEMDNPAWSQELLDWMAADFIEQGTDLKHLITQIMTSRAYQLPSVPLKEAQDLLASRYQFEGPERRRLSAEQFADGISQVLGPVYHSVAFNPLGEQIDAQWIWHREIEVDRDVLPKPGKRFFRQAFDLPDKKIKRAQALLSVDHRFVFYLNGEKRRHGSDWRYVHRINLKNRLQPGTNQIAIEGENDGELPNPAGILFSLLIDYEDGSQEKIISDDTWKSTVAVSDSSWVQEAFNDESWDRVRRYARFDRSHWGQLLEFRHNTHEQNLPFARASLVQLDPFMKALGRPTRENVTTRRDDQATLLQALELTNGAFFNEALEDGATYWAERYGKEPELLIERVFFSALGREPTPKELETTLGSIGNPADPGAVQDFLWAILMLPEFQLIY